ncbi:MAG TPA: CpaD family pilus assembly lipoprotein [Stellaceae bacterium]
MIVRRLARSALHAVTAAALVLSSGCAPAVQEWQAVEAPKTLKVDFQRLRHTVAFAPGGATLPPAESARLLAFLADAELDASDRVYLVASPYDRFAEARRTRLAELLARRGYRSESRAAAPGGIEQAAGDRTPLAGGDELAVEVERFVVVPPPCPNWSKPSGTDFGNATSSDFGCATATNLGLMVAQPRDLVVGRVPGPPQVDRVVLMEQDFRQRAPQVLNCDKTGCPAGPASAGDYPTWQKTDPSGGDRKVDATPKAAAAGAAPPQPVTPSSPQQQQQ